MRSLWRLASVVVWLVCLSIPSLGQVTTGTISGTVMDSTGAVLPGARVVILHEDTGGSRTVTTDAAGRYSAPSLNLGRYRVTASVEGFQTEVRSGIVLTVERQAIVNFELPVGAVSQSVEVMGEAPLVETTKSSVDFLVDDTTVRELPLNGRDLAQLVLLNPGVTTTELPRSSSFNYGFGKLFSISGFRTEDNLYLLDGTDINEYNNRVPSGASGSLFGTETIQEFQVKTSTFSAAYGRALGGVMNAVSKSGTNTFHGDIYEFHRNDNLDAAMWEDNALGGEKPEFRRNQFGGTLGGPIVRDRAFFFAGYEGFREERTETSSDTVPDENMRRGILPGVTPINIHPKTAPYLALFPLPNGRNFNDGRAEYIYPNPKTANEDYGQSRVDYQLSDQNSFFGRFTILDSERVEQAGLTPEFLAKAVMTSRFVTLSQTHIFSPTALNTFRLAFNRNAPGEFATYATWPAELLAVPGQPLPPIISVSGLAGLGGQSDDRFYGRTNRFEYIDEVNLNRGAHRLQFGANFQHYQFNKLHPDRPMGQWNFNSLQTFLTGIPSQYRGTPHIFADEVRGIRQNFVGMYLQDDWQITPSLTLNLGLRYDFYTVPTEVNGKLANLRHLSDPKPTLGEPFFLNKSWRDFGPRFGFAWNPFADGKTAVRGGVGIFYSRVDASQYWSSTGRDGFYTPKFQVSNPPASFFPNAVDFIRTVILGSQGDFFGASETINYENLQTPSGYQWNLTVQRQLGTSRVISLGYAGSRALNASSNGAINVPYAPFVNGGLRVPEGAGFTNRRFDDVVQVGTNSNAWYNAFQFNLQQRMSSGMQFQIAYTFSKALNITDSNQKSGIFSGAGTMFYYHDLSVNKGRGGIDVPHVFTANYVLELPFGSGRRWLASGGIWNHLFGNWDVNGIVSLKSGQPFSLTADVPREISGLVQARRPNAVAGVHPKIFGDPSESKDPQGRYYDPTVGFAPADTRALGNLGRNTLRGPGIANWDIGLTKNAPLTERMRLQFRAELFNVSNHPNFGNPAASLYDTSGRVKGNAGVISSTLTRSREIQFGLKLIF